MEFFYDYFHHGDAYTRQENDDDDGDGREEKINGKMSLFPNYEE